jgi:two-component system LytT family response regulator
MDAASQIRAIVVDDERPARRKLLRFLAAEPGIEVVGEAANGKQAVEMIQAEKPDLVFLDIQMPGMNGFGVIEALADGQLPQFIFVTAHDQFALRAFEVHALDYLLKPFDLKRFQKALAKAKEELARRKSSKLNDRLARFLDEVRPTQFVERLLVSSGDRGFLLPVDRINWIEAARNYVKLHAGGETYLLRGTIEGLFAKLDPRKFIRVNRSRVVNVDFIKELHRWFHGQYRIMLKDDTEIVWRRRYLDNASDSFLSKF